MLHETTAPEFDEELTSVPHISLEYAPGKPYIHSIESELRSNPAPRRVMLLPIRWSASHTGILNIGVGVILSSLFLERYFPASRFGSMHWSLLSCLVLGGLVLFYFMIRLLRAQRDIHYLRYGIATTGVFHSGSVNDCEETTYRLVYSFSVEGQQHSNTVSVSKSDYVRYTNANPYFTVLYYGDEQIDSVPYFQITQAVLA